MGAILSTGFTLRLPILNAFHPVASLYGHKPFLSAFFVKPRSAFIFNSTGRVRYYTGMIHFLRVFGSETRVTRVTPTTWTLLPNTKNQRKWCPSWTTRVTLQFMGSTSVASVAASGVLFGGLWCRMWQFSIFIGNRRKHKATDIWRCANEDQCVPDKIGCSCRTINTTRSASNAGLLILRMSVKLTRVTGVVLPNNLIVWRIRWMQRQLG